MPAAVVESSLTPDVLNDHHNFDISEDTYDAQFAPLIRDLYKFGITDPSSVRFDPNRHILFTDDYFEKTKRYTLEELQIDNSRQEPISNIGVSEPFPLFTDEAVAILRWEVLQKDVITKYGRIRSLSKSKDSKGQSFVVGEYSEYAKFTYEAWSHPKILEIISKMAGVELIQMFNHVHANTNISIRTPGMKLLDEDIAATQDEDKVIGITPWHFDSPQFVCVLMLSDTSKMIGGETSLVKGDGEIARVEGPKQGWANVLQGRIIKHIAPRPAGEYSERITQVSSFRPVDPLLDNCVMTTVKPGQYVASRYNEYYKDWMNYRLEVLSKRIDILKKNITASIDKGESFDQISTINFMQNKIVNYAEHTWQEFEVVDDGVVDKPSSYNAKPSIWFK
ncbi:hypothetical protein BN7_740 [Wickerhamomyces ciferrii]|uniref:Uncharacterized protein n=1 Tax=Wickerhamomyces ciferrii (strain ATCC 14091 / BCRC 22168 / CBS 111 / JCM 3599 / NBRC 0793 / NRRL Y-1031 F-60-10) TaxID=1206466 RepID=K0KJC1_WICCF|nr:uncharacterized protein BN7_740 [Wickerhamomyces ciferrii]CCH41203.1 hypothetical protein BN7_740 [Wickerhamomyces ciferrii]